MSATYTWVGDMLKSKTKNRSTRLFKGWISSHYCCASPNQSAHAWIICALAYQKGTGSLHICDFELSADCVSWRVHIQFGWYFATKTKMHLYGVSTASWAAVISLPHSEYSSDRHRLLLLHWQNVRFSVVFWSILLPPYAARYVFFTFAVQCAGMSHTRRHFPPCIVLVHIGEACAIVARFRKRISQEVCTGICYHIRPGRRELWLIAI